MATQLLKSLHAHNPEPDLVGIESESAAGNLSALEELVLGIFFLFAPLSDPLSANRHLKRASGLGRTLDAAVWGEYGYIHVHPVRDNLLPPLEHFAEIPEAIFMLAERSRFDGHFDTTEELLRRSIDLKAFPYNLLRLSDLVQTSEERNDLRRYAAQLVVDRSCENSPLCATCEDFAKRHWDASICGFRLTSVLWEHYSLREYL
jgi:hypothetical protein